MHTQVFHGIHPGYEGRRMPVNVYRVGWMTLFSSTTTGQWMDSSLRFQSKLSWLSKQRRSPVSGSIKLSPRANNLSGLL